MKTLKQSWREGDINYITPSMQGPINDLARALFTHWSDFNNQFYEDVFLAIKELNSRSINLDEFLESCQSKNSRWKF